VIPPISPARHLRQEVEAYLAEAKNPLDVKIFQCECFSLVGDELQYYVIPFVTKVELGLNASIRSFLEANDLPLTLSHGDVITNKLFKYSPINVTTKSVQVNPVGVARSGQSTTELRSYTSISITNLGNVPPERVQPNPSKPWFEFCVLEIDNKKRKGKEDISNASFVEIETEDKKKYIDILIDGELYGPVNKIRISACVVTEGEIEHQLEFPVMTYLPIDLP